MPVTIRGRSNNKLKSMKEVLDEYERDHPGTDAVIYSQNSISIRIRVIDPTFSGLERSDRHDRVWEYLTRLPEDIQSDVSMLVPLAPGEEGRSMANLEFEHPSPSLIE